MSRQYSIQIERVQDSDDWSWRVLLLRSTHGTQLFTSYVLVAEGVARDSDFARRAAERAASEHDERTTHEIGYHSYVYTPSDQPPQI